MAQREVPERELFAAKLAGFAFVLDRDNHWCFHRRQLPDGRVLYLIPKFGGNRLGVSPDAAAQWYTDVYDFDAESGGIDASWRAAIAWDGEGDPEGWVRHCRGSEIPRRRPDGKPESEYRAP
jgi:hypothetical protein